MIRHIYFIMSASLLCMSCNTRTSPTIVHEKSESLDYIVNENLSLKDFSGIQGYFPSEGFVSTADLAFQIAEPVLINLYGKDIIVDEKSFFINLENGIWMIKGTLKDDKDGGVTYMEIDKRSGQILKAIHTK